MERPNDKKTARKKRSSSSRKSTGGSYSIWCLRTFGKFVERHKDAFGIVKNDLAKTNMNLTIEEYGSMALVTTLLAPLFLVPTVIFICLLLAAGIFTIIIATLLSSLLIAGLVFFGFYIYPSLQAEGLKKSIDNNLPFATVYLSTLAGTGLPISKMFRILAEFKEYGEVSRQAAAIVTDTEVLGIDITTALAKATRRTPSQELKDLFWGIRSTIMTGGDLRSYLIEKGEGFMQDYRRSLDIYVEQLGLFTELYITAIVVGSILFIVMSTIMGLLGSSQVVIQLVQTLVVYAVLPIISIVFMIIISLLSPAG